MRSVSVRLADLDRVKINLGFAGENEHTHVLFDCKKAFDQYPNATPFLIVTPPRGDIYPAVVTRDGDIVEWVVTDSDLIYHGNGKVQLQFKQGDIIMKSYEAMTSIAKSSEPTGTVPTPIQNWITQANAILASIPDDINAALAAAKASGEFDGADGVGIAAITLKSTVGLVDTYTITLTDGSDYDFTVTNGTPGQNGVGIQSIAKTSTVGLVDTYTITLTNGQTYPFTVTNGQNGVEIDDTTPANNKVFSSSKVDQELTDVKTAIHSLENDKYEKPSGGIPKTDLASDVQTSIRKADTALQANDVATAVDAWCNENITNPDSPPLDRSLTSSSAATPADIVGELKSALGNRFKTYDKVLTENNSVIMNFELGYVSVIGTSLNWWADNTKYLRTIKNNPIQLFAGDTLVFDDTVYRCQIVYSKDNGTTWNSTGWITNSPYAFSSNGIGYVEIGKKTDTDISAEINTVYNALTVYRGQYTETIPVSSLLPFALDNNGAVRDYNSSNRKTTDFIKVNGKFSVSCPNYIAVYLYDTSKTFDSKSADWAYAEYHDYVGYIRISENTANKSEPITLKMFNSYSDNIVRSVRTYEANSVDEINWETVTVHGSELKSITLDNSGNISTQDTNGRFTSEFIKLPKGTIIKCNTIAVFEYNSKKEFILKNEGWVNSYVTVNDGYVRIMEFSSNGTTRNITIIIPYRINGAYIKDYPIERIHAWRNSWIFDGSHRGYCRYIAPDTIPAYVNSKEKGYNSIEGDIRVTSDGEYVIHHDDGMPSSSSYKISEHTLAELRANANMGYYNGSALQILTLKEWLLLAKNLDMFVFAEMKAELTSEQIIEVMTIARDCGMQDRVAWMATASNAETFRTFYPACYLAIINTLDYSSVSSYVLENFPDRAFIYTSVSNITETFVHNCASVGLGVVGWCVSFDWLYGEGEWTETSVKADIKRAMGCGLKGMVLDYWTLAEIYEEEYEQYL